MYMGVCAAALSVCNIPPDPKITYSQPRESEAWSLSFDKKKATKQDTACMVGGVREKAIVYYQNSTYCIEESHEG